MGRDQYLRRITRIDDNAIALWQAPEEMGAGCLQQVRRRVGRHARSRCIHRDIGITRLLYQDGLEAAAIFAHVIPAGHIEGRGRDFAQQGVARQIVILGGQDAVVDGSFSREGQQRHGDASVPAWRDNSPASGWNSRR